MTDEEAIYLLNNISLSSYISGANLFRSRDPGHLTKVIWDDDGFCTLNGDFTPQCLRAILHFAPKDK